MTFPTAQDLATLLNDGKGGTEEQGQRFLDIINSVEGGALRGWRIIRAASNAMDAYGAESIVDCAGRAVCHYVVTGDAYTGTLLHDVEENAVLVTTYGDWLEAYETKSGIELP